MVGYFLGNCLFVFRVSEPLSLRAGRFLFLRAEVFPPGGHKKAASALTKAAFLKLALSDGHAHGSFHCPGMAIS
jgi:hypothetical protein